MTSWPTWPASGGSREDAPAPRPGSRSRHRPPRPGDRRPDPRRPARARQLAHLLRRPRRPAVLAPQPDHARQREHTQARVDLPGGRAGHPADQPDRGGRGHVPDRVSRPRGGARRPLRPGAVAVPADPAAHPAGARVRAHQPGHRRTRQHGLRGRPGRPAHRARRPLGGGALDRHRGRQRPGLRHDRRAARRRGPGRGGRERSGGGDSRIPRCLRCPHRGAALAVPHHSRPRGARQRHLGRGQLADRRRLHLGNRQLRSRAGPAVLGRGQSGPALER